MSKVSIVLPTYNGEKYLRQSIDSCLNQSFSDLELIVVIDGSTDSTLNIIQSYCDSRLQIIHFQTNKRLPAALNSGFAISKGDYLTWTSDDNYYDRSTIEKLVDFLDKNLEVDFVYTDFFMVDREGNKLCRKNVTSLSEIKTMSFTIPCFLYRRKVYEGLGDYSESAYLAEDYEYWLRIYKNFRMYHLKNDEPFYFYRDHEGSLTSKFRWKSHEKGVMLRRQILGISWFEYCRQMAFVNIEAAFEAYRLEDYSEVLRCYLRAMVKDPTWMLRNRGLLKIIGISSWKQFQSKLSWLHHKIVLTL